MAGVIIGCLVDCQGIPIRIREDEYGVVVRSVGSAKRTRTRSAFRDKYVLSLNVRLLPVVREEWSETRATFFFPLRPQTKVEMFNLRHVLPTRPRYRLLDRRVLLSAEEDGGDHRSVENNFTIEHADRLGEGDPRVDSWADVTAGNFFKPMTNAMNIRADAEYISGDMYKILTQVSPVWFQEDAFGDAPSADVDSAFDE